jgi:hypothetical protein
MRAIRGTRPAVNDSVQPPSVISAANDTNLLNRRHDSLLLFVIR